MRALIYGGGAVGLGLAGALIKAGWQTGIIARERAVSLLNSEGLARDGIFGEYSALPGSFSGWTALDEIPEDLSGTFDFILVCVKSFDSFFAAKDIYAHRRLLSDRGILVLCQNGWGNAGHFTALFKNEKVFNGRVITGFSLKKPNGVTITVHADALHFGSLFGEALEPVQPLAAALTEGGLPSEVTGSIGKDLWAKMLYNCSLNSLGALFGVPYGVLGDHEEARLIMDNIIEEIFTLLTAAGFSTHWKSADEYKEIFYGKLIPLTAKHKSSTLQDLLAGKKTEIEGLNGAVLALGRELKLKVPYNEMVYHMVKFKEQLGR